MKRKEISPEIKEKCYICLDVVKCPLQICFAGHFACALCLSNQIEGQRQYVCVPGQDFVPTLQVKNRTNIMRCGICNEERCLPKYPGGALADTIIQSTIQITQCPMCHVDDIPPKKLGEHILTCQSRKVPCLYCTSDTPVFKMESHFRQECQHLPCNDCGVKMNARAFASHHATHEMVDRLCNFAQNMFSSSAFKRHAVNNMDGFIAAISILTPPPFS